MNTRIDRFKVKRLMKHAEINTLEALAQAAKLSPTTINNALDGYNWRSTTLDALAAALGCNPTDILTVDEASDFPKVRTLVGVAA